jgi:hypothetical protein
MKPLQLIEFILLTTAYFSLNSRSYPQFCKLSAAKNKELDAITSVGPPSRVPGDLMRAFVSKCHFPYWTDYTWAGTGTFPSYY